MPVEAAERRRAPMSVFVKVLITLLVMALLILVVVVTFVRFFYGAQFSGPVDRVIRHHVALLARDIGDPPTVDRARRVAVPSGFQVRYEGRDGAWATARDLPSVAEARAALRARGFQPSLFNRDYLVEGPAGTLLFRWDFGWAAALHNEVLATVIVLIIVFVLGAHVAIRYHLRPIRSLRQGVTRLADGDFQVRVPVAGNDELGMLSDAFNGMTERLRGMLQARDQLLADVSHELRSPITRMKLALEFVADDEKKRSLEADLREMETMVVELLEIERLKDGRGGLQLERTSLSVLARDVACEQNTRPPGVRLVPVAEDVAMLIDARRMRVVLKNLLENSLKYSSPESRPVEVQVSREGDAAVVRVSDEGPGIPADELERVFDPFFRVDRSRSKESGGYGLGLAMCKRIVEAHGGRIALANNAGRGLTATVALPMSGARVSRS